MRGLMNAMLAMIALSCATGKMPDEPEHLGVSLPFECRYSGFVVLKGWLVVDQKAIDAADDLGVDIADYYLQCESPVYSALNCTASFDV